MIREGACGLRGQSKFGVTNFISFPRKRVRSSPCVFILLSILLITNAVLPRESLDPTGAGPLEFLVSQVVVMAKSLLAKAGGTNDAGVIPGLGRSPGKGMITYSIILAWRVHGQRGLVGTVHGAAKSQTQLSTERPSLVTSTLKLFIVFSGFL